MGYESAFSQPNPATPAWPNAPVLWPTPVQNPTLQWQSPALPTPSVMVAPTTHQQQSPVPHLVPATTTAMMSQQ